MKCLLDQTEGTKVNKGRNARRLEPECGEQRAFLHPAELKFRSLRTNRVKKVVPRVAVTPIDPSSIPVSELLTRHLDERGKASRVKSLRPLDLLVE